MSWPFGGLDVGNPYNSCYSCYFTFTHKDAEPPVACPHSLTTRLLHRMLQQSAERL